MIRDWTNIRFQTKARVQTVMNEYSVQKSFKWNQLDSGIHLEKAVRIGTSSGASGTELG